MLRSSDITLDKAFTVEGAVVKSWTSSSGERFIRGVASGVEVDRDGERVSKAAIAEMAEQCNAGGVKMTAAHQQDWLTECGDVIKGEVDPQTNQLLIDVKLPPEGEDPIADKAWKQVNREATGFSIGGKLRKAFFERDDLGKQRKVLDSILLRHVALTKTPSYAMSFAEAVAKTFEEPEQLEWVEKADEPQGGDSATGDRNAGVKSKDKAVMNVEDNDESDEKDEKAAPKATRSLACPNCGHEFAADLPTDADMSEPAGDDDTNDEHAAKTAQENDMPTDLSATLDDIKALAADPEAVEKTEPEVVAKSADDVEKTLSGRIEQLEAQLAEAFEIVGKTQQALLERIEALPLGRKSTARILPTRDAVEKSAEDDDVATAPDAVSALKALNERTYGIR